MPYYIYRIESGATSLVSRLTMLEKHAEYRTAKVRVRGLRESVSEGVSLRVIFAPNELMAEELLSEQRERPILAEWEK